MYLLFFHSLTNKLRTVTFQSSGNEIQVGKLHSILTTLYRLVCLIERHGGMVCTRYLDPEIIHIFRTLFHINNNREINFQKKNPRILPPRCFLLASSWSIIPPEVVITMYLKKDGKITLHGKIQSYKRPKLISVRCRGNLCSKIRAEELQFGNIFSSTILEDGNN